MLACPVCKGALVKTAHSFICSQQHTFDIAKEGYVNLVVPRKGVPQSRGDTCEMLKARRSFLEKGYFDFLFKVLHREISDHLYKQRREKSLNILDVGCGEGYSLKKIRQHLQENFNPPSNINCYGLDIAKDAVRMAARANPNCILFAANIHSELPVLDGTVAVLTGMLAPRNFAEFHRVLENGGTCLIVIPTPKHLVELRPYVSLLRIAEEKEHDLMKASQGFALTKKVLIEEVGSLSIEDVNAVLKMTPNYWHRAKQKAVSLPGTIATTFSFKLLCFSRV